MTDFIATLGNNVFSGGAGATDQVDYHTNQVATGVKVDLTQTGAQQTYGSGQDTLTSIENVLGTDFMDIIAGNAGDNLMRGYAGSDTLSAGAGGTDQLYGGDGFDTLTVSYTQAGQATLYGDAGNDTFNITLNAANQSATASGGAGDDRFNVNATGAVQLSLGAGSDTVTLGAAQTGIVTITDFQIGDAGDVLDLYTYLKTAATGWDQTTNPFGTYARLNYAAGATTLQVKTNGSWHDVVILQNVTPGDLTARNFGGYPTDGSEAPGLTSYGGVATGTRGTVGADVLFGGSHDDVLKGAAGDDILGGGGYGNDILTGGAGADIFVIDSGLYAGTNDQTTITDFTPGVDKIYFYGGSAVSGHQLYFDGTTNHLTVAVDGAGKVILDGITWSDSLLTSFVFLPHSPSPPVAVPVITSSATPQDTVTVTGSLNVAAGTTVHHVNPAGRDTAAVIMSGDQAVVTNSGIILTDTVDANAGATTLFFDGSFSHNPSDYTTYLHNNASGQILAHSVNSNAYAYYAGSRGASFTNDGLIEAVSDHGSAYAVTSFGFYEWTGGMVNNGSILAYGSVAAEAVEFANYGTFTNTGTIKAYADIANAVVIYRPSEFLNTGTIEAHGTSSDSPSVAVGVGNWQDVHYINSGTISGDYSFLVREEFSSGLPTASAEFIDNRASGVMTGDIDLAWGADKVVNAGHISGDIWFGEGNDTLTNTGTLIGDTYFDGGNDTYDSTAGQNLNAAVYGGEGNDTLRGGAGQQFLYGEAGNDVIDGGAGDDWIDGGEGVNMLAGGLGSDVLSFRSRMSGVTVDLVSGTVTGGGGTGQASGFETVLGSAYADTLLGTSSGEVMQGENGNDTLDGRGGSDYLTGGRGADQLTGGTGSDTFTYNKGDGQDVITDFTVGQDSLHIGGISAFQSITQDGADTVLAFSDGGSIRLKNVVSSTFTAASYVFGADTSASLAADPGTPRFDGQYQYFTSDFVVPTGTVYEIVDQGFGFISGGDSSLDNSGTLKLVTSGGATGLFSEEYQSGPSGTSFINRAGGTFFVESNGTPGTTGVAYGMRTLVRRMDFDNRGTWTVVSTGAATGAELIANDTVISNSGTLEVYGKVSATGLYLYSPTSITNTGTIRVEGGTTATGIVSSIVGSALVNSGTIIVSTAPGGTSTGLSLNAYSISNDKLAGFVNSGTIVADTALSISAGGQWAFRTTNSGSIYGNVDLYGSGNTLRNTGLIAGNVTFGNGDDTYDATGGGTITGTITGGDGNDTLVSGAGNETFTGGAGVDTISYASATAGVTTSLTDGAHSVAGFGTDTITSVEGLIGSNFADTLSGSAADNRLTGGLGNDTLTGAGGADTFYLTALDGNDTITDFSSNDIINVDDAFGYDNYLSLTQSGADTIVTFEGGQTITLKNVTKSILTTANFQFRTDMTVMNLTGTSGNDVLIGRNNNDILIGLGGDDVIDSGGGYDTLSGGDGNDIIFSGSGLNTIDGGAGSDTIDYSHQTAGMSIGIENGFAYKMAVGQIEYFQSIENVVGSAFGDSIYGSAVANKIYGGGGDDVLSGGGGADLLDGGAGKDVASYVEATAGVTVFLGGPQLNTGDAAGDTYVSIENLTGSAFADILGGDNDNNLVNGLAGNDWLFGAGGNDKLYGGDGNDVLEGGAGGDSFFGGDGIDVASYRNATTGIRIDAKASTGNTGDAEDDGFSSIENIWGSDYDDTIWGDDVSGQVYGFAGNDILAGRGGNDVFYGGTGVDYMEGGAGADDFFYLSWNNHYNQYGTLEAFEGGDTITDFTHGTDHIIVSRYWFGFGNIAGPAAALTSTYADFKTSGGATSTRPTFFWNQATGLLEFDPDGTGAGAKVTLATLSGGATLTLSDIWTA